MQIHSFSIHFVHKKLWVAPLSNRVVIIIQFADTTLAGIERSMRIHSSSIHFVHKKLWVAPLSTRVAIIIPFADTTLDGIERSMRIHSSSIHFVHKKLWVAPLSTSVVIIIPCISTLIFKDLGLVHLELSSERDMSNEKCPLIKILSQIEPVRLFLHFLILVQLIIIVCNQNFWTDFSHLCLTQIFCYSDSRGLSLCQT